MVHEINLSQRGIYLSEAHRDTDLLGLQSCDVAQDSPQTILSTGIVRNMAEAVRIHIRGFFHDGETWVRHVRSKAGTRLSHKIRVCRPDEVRQALDEIRNPSKLEKEKKSKQSKQGARGARGVRSEAIRIEI